MSTKEPDYKYYYINHYTWKSTEEYLNKVMRGDAVYGNSRINKIGFYDILRYFKHNKINQEKIKYITNRTVINATKIVENLEKEKLYNKFKKI